MNNFLYIMVTDCEGTSAAQLEGPFENEKERNTRYVKLQRENEEASALDDILDVVMIVTKFQVSKKTGKLA
jgi:hypothetical protein